MESVFPIKVSVIGAGSAKSIRGAEPENMVGERRGGDTCTNMTPRHVGVLIESLGLEIGNTVQNPEIVDDVKDENPVKLGPRTKSASIDLTWPGACSSAKTWQT